MGWSLDFFFFLLHGTAPHLGDDDVEALLPVDWQGRTNSWEPVGVLYYYILWWLLRTFTVAYRWVGVWTG